MSSLVELCKIKSQFEILSIPFNIENTDCSREARHEQSQWQYDPRKAKIQKETHRRRTGKSITEHRDDLYRVLSKSRFHYDDEYLKNRDKK